MKVALISTLDSPLLFFYLKEIVSIFPRSTHIIYDSNKKKDHMKEVWKQRTNFYFENNLANLFNRYGKIMQKAKIHYVSSHNSKDMKKLLLNEKFDYLINVGTQLKIQKKIIESARFGIINIHPGILPYYRGCTCVEWAIYNDERIGKTIHLMNSEYDTGNILSIEKYNFKKSDTYVDIRLKVYLKGIKLVGKILKKIKLGALKEIDYTLQHKSDGKFWRPIDKYKLNKVFNKIKNKKYKYQL